MTGFASLDQLISALTVSGQRGSRGLSKVGTAGLAGSWMDLWGLAGQPAAGAAGAAGSASAGAGGTAFTGTSTTGAITYPNVAGSGFTRHLIEMFAAANQNATLMLYDRLVGVGSLSVAAAATLNVNSVALPRYASTSSGNEDYAGANEAWLRVTTATTTTAAVVTMNSYTNENGVAGHAGTSVTFPAAATPLHVMVGPLPLAAGDQGLTSVQTISVGTAASAGVVELVILRELAWCPLIANMGNIINFVTQIPALPRLFDGHCLGAAILMPATTATSVNGQLIAGHN